MLPVPAYGVGHARVAGREHRGVVDQSGEQGIHRVHALHNRPVPPQARSDADDDAAEDVDAQLTRLRSACLALPQTAERPSHGGPAFFIRDKKCFVMFLDDHHGDGRLAIWCAAPDGVQVELVETDPERFFRPPYVGHRGWLGVLLRTVDDHELTAIVTEAFRTIAPPTLLRELDTA